MAQITVDRHDLGRAGTVDPGADHDRVRSLVPTAVAVGLLLAVVVAGGLAVRTLLDFGLWLLAQ